MSDAIRIERLSPEHIPALSELAALTYRSTYQDSLTPEEVEARLAGSHRQEDYAAQFSDPSQQLWGLFDSEKLVGFLQLSMNTSSPKVPTEGLIEVYRIYMNPTHQGRGLGARLIAKAEELCRELGRHGLWLRCYDRNAGAIRFYERLGYQLVGSDSFEILPGLVRLDLVLIKRLLT